MLLLLSLEDGKLSLVMRTTLYTHNMGIQNLWYPRIFVQNRADEK